MTSSKQQSPPIILFATTRETYGHNFQHLLSGYISVTVQIIHRKGPLEFLFEFAPGGDREGAQELPEVDGAVPVRVESPEHVLRELTCIPVRKEISINFFELVDTKMSARTVF